MAQPAMSVKRSTLDQGSASVRISRDLGVDNFNELMALAKSVDEGEDVLIDFGRHELRFEDTRLSDLKASDFDFI
jgi:serralysin